MTRDELREDVKAYVSGAIADVYDAYTNIALAVDEATDAILALFGQARSDTSLADSLVVSEEMIGRGARALHKHSFDRPWDKLSHNERELYRRDARLVLTAALTLTEGGK